jgi:tripartite-type tricarboxylate transporter receptor subunit TctC
MKKLSKYVGFGVTGAMIGAAAGTFSMNAFADDFPSKTITMVIPFAAGGPTDTVGRLVGQSMGKELKQTIIIENVGGAGGTVGAAKVARSAPDGYTIFLHHIGHSTAPALYKKMSYNPIDDFEPIGLVTDVPMTIVARKDFPAKDFKEMVTYVKANAAKLNYANAGLGSASHLCGMLFMSTVEADMTTVPFKGTGPAMTDLLAGQVDLMCDQTTNTTSQIKGEKIKAYAVTTKNKVPSLPDIPTAESQGLKGFDVAVWHGLYAPKATPKPALDKLQAALLVALKDPEVVKRMADLGTEPVAPARATPAALKAHLKSEIDRWGPIIKKAGVYAD